MELTLAVVEVLPTSACGTPAAWNQSPLIQSPYLIPKFGTAISSYTIAGTKTIELSISSNS